MRMQVYAEAIWKFHTGIIAAWLDEVKNGRDEHKVRPCGVYVCPTQSGWEISCQRASMA